MKIRARWALFACLALVLALASGDALALAPAPRSLARGAGVRPPSPLRLLSRATGRKPLTVMFVEGSFRMAGSPYRWRLGAGHLRQHTLVALTADQPLLGGDQSHTWLFRLPLDALGVGTRLHTAHLHTGTGLGAFGTIDLSFAGSERIHTRSFRCPTTHAVLTTDMVRRGGLTGTFDFTPNEGTLPDAHLTSMKGSAVRLHISGRGCSGDQPSFHGCFRGSTFEAEDQGFGADLYAPLGSDFIAFDQVERIGPATVQHSLFVSSVGRLARKTATGMVVDATALAPQASGTLVFTDGLPRVHVGRRCEKTRTPEAWSSGTITVNFDSGPIDFTGSGLKARLLTFAKAR